MMAWKLGKQMLILLTSFSFICVFFSGFLFSVYHLSSKTIKSSQNFVDFRILEVDSSGEKISRGIVSFPDNFFGNEENEYVTYTAPNENHVLISKFGTEEFVCTGSCYCNENYDEERRIAASSNIRKGVTTLIAALSSVLAYEKAKEYFSEECETKLSQTCSSSSIETEIDSCELLTSEENVYLESETTTETMNEEGSVENSEELNSNMRVFECEGECVPKKDIEEWVNGKQAKEKLEEMNYCKDYKYEKEIKMDGNEYSEIREEALPQRRVNQEFRKEVTSHCKKISEVSLVKPRYTKTYQASLCKLGKYGCRLKKRSTEVRKYWCKGSCKKRKTSSENVLGIAEHVNCGALEAEGEVTFSTEEMLNRKSYLRAYHISRHQSVHAKNLFQTQVLVNFCKSNSIRSYNAVIKGGRREWRKVMICSVDSKSIHCVQTYPADMKSTNHWNRNNKF